MNSYKNPIEDYETKAIKAWQVADKLKASLEAAEQLVYWNMQAEGFDNGFKEGYNHLVEEINEAIPMLRKIY